MKINTTGKMIIEKKNTKTRLENAIVQKYKTQINNKISVRTREKEDLTNKITLLQNKIDTLSKRDFEPLEEEKTKIFKQRDDQSLALDMEKKTVEQNFEQEEKELSDAIITKTAALEKKKKETSKLETKITTENPIQKGFWSPEKPQEYNVRISNIIKTNVHHIRLTSDCASIKGDLDNAEKRKYTITSEKRKKLDEIDGNKRELRTQAVKQVENLEISAEKSMQERKHELKEQINNCLAEQKKIIAEIDQLKKPVVFNNISPDEYLDEEENLKRIGMEIKQLEHERHTLEGSVNELKKKMAENIGSSDQIFSNAFSKAFVSLSKASTTYKCAGYQWQKTTNLIMNLQAEMLDQLGTGNEGKLETWANQLIDSSAQCKRLLDTKFLDN